MFFWEFILDSSLLTPSELHIQPYWLFLKIVLTYFVQLLCFYNICCISIFVRKIGMQYQIAADRNFYTTVVNMLMYTGYRRRSTCSSTFYQYYQHYHLNLPLPLSATTTITATTVPPFCSKLEASAKWYFQN